MIIHDLIQGSDEWNQFRLEHFGASEAAMMLGLSKKATRTDLLNMKKTGLGKEFSEWVQKNILDNGHRVEALARPIIEDQIGTELYPVTCSEGILSASCDGLTLDEETAFEHKQWNTDLAALVDSGVVPDDHMPQCQQILMVTGAKRVIFVVSDGTADKMVQAEVLPDPEWFERIQRGWNQFAQDLQSHTPTVAPVQAVGRTPETLPALRIEVTGHVTASNLIAFKEHALAVFEGINTDLTTDQDFADAEKTVKWCGEVEDKLAAAKAHALGQTESIDALFKAIDDIAAEARAKRLELDKLVKQRKETIRQEILVEGQAALAAHIKALNEKLGKAYMPTILADFAGAMKGKKTVTSLRDAVQTVLANAKVEADTVAERIQANLTTLREFAKDHTFLFADTATIVLKANDDLTMLVKQRLADHQAAEEKKLEAERERIRSEEAAKAQVAQVVQQPVQQAVQQPAPVQKQAAVKTDEMMTLGEVKAKLAPIQITEDGLQSVGFAPAGTRMASKLYLVSDFPRICQALIEHLENTMQEATA